MVFNESGDYQGSYDEQTANDIIDEHNGNLYKYDKPQ